MNNATTAAEMYASRQREVARALESIQGMMEVHSKMVGRKGADFAHIHELTALIAKLHAAETELNDAATFDSANW
jgi:hypothetical protein